MKVWAEMAAKRRALRTVWASAGECPARAHDLISVPGNDVKGGCGAGASGSGDGTIEGDAAGRIALDHAAGARCDHGVLAEGDARQRLVEAELAQHRRRIGGELPAALIDGGDGAAGTGLHPAQ